MPMLPSTKVTELALRAAVNSTAIKPTTDGNPTEDIKTNALNRAKELVLGNSTSSSLSGQMDLQSMAIGAAVAGLGLAISATIEQVKVLKNKRLAFDIERATRTGTFVLPTNKEERNLSTEECIIKTFIKLISETKLTGNSLDFCSYFGFEQSILVELV